MVHCRAGRGGTQPPRENRGVVSGRVARPSASAVTMATVSLRRAPPPPWDFKLLPFPFTIRAGGAHQGRQGGIRGLLYTSTATLSAAATTQQRPYPRHRTRHTHTYTHRTRTLGKSEKGSSTVRFDFFSCFSPAYYII